jgi:methylmalonyl-CoA/ethylmalonyl-CoA epimerase
MLRQIDHVAIAVHDLEEAISLYRPLFREDFYMREVNEEQGFEVAAFRVGHAHIEFLSPTRPDSVIAGFIHKHGGGIHHIAFEVDNLIEAVDVITASKFRLVNDTPRRGTSGSQIIFVHPKSALGTMIEFVELPKSEAP